MDRIELQQSDGEVVSAHELEALVLATYYIVTRELESTSQDRVAGKKDQQLSSNLGPTLYCGVSDMRATDPGRDLCPQSSLSTRHGCATIQRPLKTRASMRVLCVV